MKPAPFRKMDFLADESFDFRLVRALRAAGHDVTTVAEQAVGADDTTVMRLAVAGNRVLLTEDKDFGALVHVSAMPARGVILLRCPESDRAGMAAKLIGLVALHDEELRGGFVVVTPDKVRFSKLPNVAG